MRSSSSCTKWSASYLKRNELMNSLEIPTISETKQELGEVLADIVFDQCHEQLKEDLGLKPPLEGAGNELWTSPSDLLIGKVCLKPPLTQKHIQALTHNGILEIGAEIEQKYWNEMENEKKKALKEQEEMLRRLCEMQKEELRESTKRDEQEKYLKKLTEIRCYYDHYIDTLVDAMSAEMRRHEEVLRFESAALNDSWEDKLKSEVERTVIDITQEFLQKMQQQEDVLVKIFTQKLNESETRRKCEIQFERNKCLESLIQLKHSLECKNIANLMYLLCKERRKCHDQKLAIETEYEHKVKSLERVLREKTHKVALLTRMKERKTKQVSVRERCLLEILKQFQKFIYFALRASPTQAEFLLDLDKMMKIELKNYCIDPDVKTKSKTGSIKHPLGQIQLTSTQKASSKIEIIPELADDVPAGVETSENRDKSDVLPAFYLNERMYVREDFRNMFSKGVDINKNHPLWNEDVEELMNIFREAVQKERQRDSLLVSSKRSHYSQHSVVHFTALADTDTCGLADTSTVELVQVMGEIHRDNSLKTDDSDSIELPRPSANVRNARKSIIQASDSLELMKESIRSSKSNLDVAFKTLKTNDRVRGSITSEVNPTIPRRSSLKHDAFSCAMGQLEPVNLTASQEAATTQARFTLVARDSVILRIGSMERNLTEEATKSLESKDMDKRLASTASLNHGNMVKSSKLALHCDSLEILRSTTKLSMTVIAKNQQTVNDVISKTSVVKINPYAINVTTQNSTRRPARGAGKKVYKRRPIHKAHVVGNRQMKVHLQSPKEFTTERLHSLVNILSCNPSLMRLFTAVNSQCSSQ